ncbi:hypothetical protein E2562_010284 [Oryza meyeriana var. granulata]|uniref:Uncharacterized protein n=1 Tax=Oryza meyeriana var. granulata TaxID=110450 RepID=A0A6G1EJV7_9ORYZ|nr:hypothetical protein E2562_010284 [Oryza meyeriana var. granulata]
MTTLKLKRFYCYSEAGETPWTAVPRTGGEDRRWVVARRPGAEMAALVQWMAEADEENGACEERIAAGEEKIAAREERAGAHIV